MNPLLQKEAILYRTGGSDRYTWSRVLETYEAGSEALVEKVLEINKMGYATIVISEPELAKRGFPRSYFGYLPDLDTKEYGL